MAYLPTQMPLTTLECPISRASEALASGHGTEARGAIFTRPEVVDFILDLAGYSPSLALHRMRVLEPSCGAGDFLIPLIRRLIQAWRQATPQGNPLADLSNAIRAFELHRETVHITRQRIQFVLQQEGLSAETALSLSRTWLIQGDFLLAAIDGSFDFVLGNPPYVRQELIPAALLTEYRHRYKTLYDRADLYVPFIERSLSLLAPAGKLGFICADRWMKNRYGGPLRALIAQEFHLQAYIDMSTTPAFQAQVSAYPAITIISRSKPGTTRVAHPKDLDPEGLSTLAHALRAEHLAAGCSNVRELAQITNGAEPWLLESADQMALIRRIEKQYPLLEEAGCKVGIGVATGADKAFIGPLAELDVEPDRKLPLVTTKDIRSGEILWQGQGVINPFKDSGGLVDLQAYPRLRRYLEQRREVIANRHCAKKTPENWYRTIDRITPALTHKPKLLIPDIKGQAHVVFEPGELYPHHNLYFVTSDTWDLRALQAVLLSSLSRLFVATYSTKMRGGFLRFQAQYLRRIRLPYWSEVPEALRAELANAAETWDMEACNRATEKLYGLSPEELAAIGGNGN